MFSAPTPPPPPKPPKPIPPPAQPAPPPDVGNKAALKGGVMSTILTSPQGDLSPAKTAKKTLLGGA